MKWSAQTKPTTQMMALRPPLSTSQENVRMKMIPRLGLMAFGIISKYNFGVKQQKSDIL